jgi:hypothetical protein
VVLALTDLSREGSGQQHGSVYWKKGAEAILKNLQGDAPLHAQLEHAFSVRHLEHRMSALQSS